MTTGTFQASFFPCGGGEGAGQAAAAQESDGTHGQQHGQVLVPTQLIGQYQGIRNRHLGSGLELMLKKIICTNRIFLPFCSHFTFSV